MSLPTVLSFTLATADADGICQSQTPGGAGNLTINGELASGGVATMDVARHLSVASTANLSALTFTFTGTDRYGQALTEAIAGPNNSTVKTTRNFKTITQIAISGAAGGALTVGTADEAETAWVPLDYTRKPYVMAAVQLSSGASLTWGIQWTNTPLETAGFQGHSAYAVDDALLTAKTASAAGGMEAAATGIRMKVTAFVSGTATFTVTQGIAR